MLRIGKERPNRVREKSRTRNGAEEKEETIEEEARNKKESERGEGSGGVVESTWTTSNSQRPVHKTLEKVEGDHVLRMTSEQHAGKRD